LIGFIIFPVTTDSKEEKTLLLLLPTYLGCGLPAFNLDKGYGQLGYKARVIE
jgi:hypothetical protein